MEKSAEYKKEMLALLEREGEVTSSHFKALMPGIPEQTVFSRIRALERQGVIYESGRGKYTLGSKPEYRIELTPKMRELNSLIMSEFINTGFCISLHKGNNILIETDKGAVESVTAFLRSRYPGVYSFREAAHRRTELEDSIVVKPLVTNSPLLSQDGMDVPSLEKALVDIVADRDFFRYDDELIMNEYQRAFEVYPINSNRILRYAGRRNMADPVSTFISSVNMERVKIISTIQRVLSTQPVLRAWLFGSWSRREERPDSDIDLLVDLDNTVRISLLDYAGYSLELQDSTGRQIDLIENGHLRPFAQKSANHDKYLIYERRA